MRRRIFVTTVLGLGAGAWAQHPAHPIARPRPPFLPGRYNDDDGVVGGVPPGQYVVVGVDTRGDTLTLRDAGGSVSLVHVNKRLFDIASLKPGDAVEVDLLVPDAGSSRLEAGGLWKVQR